MPSMCVEYLPLQNDMPQDDLFNEESKDELAYDQTIISHVHKLKRALTKTVEKTSLQIQFLTQERTQLTQTFNRMQQQCGGKFTGTS
jgi:hypothetical protein